MEPAGTESESARTAVCPANRLVTLSTSMTGELDTCLRSLGPRELRDLRPRAQLRPSQRSLPTAHRRVGTVPDVSAQEPAGLRNRYQLER